MMKRALSLLLCLIMVLGLAVPSVQAAESSSGNIMDGVYIDGDSGANIVIDGNTVTSSGENTKLPNPSDLVTNPTTPSAPVVEYICKCADLATAVEHVGICNVKAPYMQLCEMTAQELFALWGSYTLLEKDFIMGYLYNNFPLKHVELQKLLNAPTGSASETYTDGTTVSVQGIPQNGSVTVGKAADEVKDIVDAYVAENEKPSTELFSYDVSVQDGQGADWQPETSVKMELDLPGQKLHKYTQVYVVHVDDEGNATTIEAQVTEDGKVAFETPGFSAFYGFTVDFDYEGVQFSIPGMSSIKLSQLFDNLKMPLNAADVVNVEYTDYTQLKIEQLEGDWLLTSLKAFDTEEKLTLTMADGTVYNIKVTDDPVGYRAYCYFASRGTTSNEGDIESSTSGNGFITLSLYGEYGADGEDDDETNYYDYNDDWCPTTPDWTGVANYWRDQPVVFDGRNLGGAIDIEIKPGTTKTNNYCLGIWNWNLINGAIVNVHFLGFDSGDTITIKNFSHTRNNFKIEPLFTITNGSLFFNVTSDTELPSDSGYNSGFERSSCTPKEIIIDDNNLAQNWADASIFVDDNADNSSNKSRLYFNGAKFINNPRRALYIQANTMPLCMLENCIFDSTIKSSAGGGGAIYISHQTSDEEYVVNVEKLTLNNCDFLQNTAVGESGNRGGAILVWGNLDNTTFTDCYFYKCHPAAQGGAVAIGHHSRSEGTGSFNMGNFTFTRCTFEGTYSGDSLAGAVLIAQNSTAITFDSCKFGSDETGENGYTTVDAKSHGGAIHIGSTDNNRIPLDSLKVTGCTFKNCSASGIGGALRLVTEKGYNNAATAVEISNSNFINCSATNSGGAVALDCVKLGTVQLLNNTFTGNSSDNHGGAVFIGCSYAADAITAGAMTKGTGVTVGAVSVEGCSFTSNQASSLGGGLCITDGTYASVTMKTTTFDQCRTRGFGGGFAMKSISEAAKKTTPVTVTGDVKITACEFTYCHSGRVEPVYTDDASTIPNYWDHDNDPSTPDVMEINGGFGGGGIALGGTYKGIVEIKGESKDKPMLFQNCTTWNSGGAITFNQDMTIYGRTVTDSTTKETKEVGLTLQFLNIDKCFARDAGNGIYFNTVAFDPVLIDHCTIQNCDYFNPNNTDFTAVAAADKNDVLNTRYFVTPNGYTTAQKTEWLKEWQTDKVYITSDSSGTIRTVGTSSINAVMDSCTFNNNGSYTSGGVIYWNANNKLKHNGTDTVTPQLIVRGSTFTGNRARYHGGGLYCEAAVMVQGCEFKENTAGYCGGGIAQNMYSWKGRDIVAGENNNLNLTAGSDGKNTTIHNNTAKNGGGIGIILGETASLKAKPDFLYPVQFTLGGASVYDNTASENGGGIYYYVTKYDEAALQQEVDCYDKKIDLNNGYVYNNKAQNGNGGGIYMNSNQVNLPKKDANGNYTELYGSSTVTISNASVYSNKAYAGNGGGIYLTGENAVCEVTGGAVGALLTKENNKDVLTAGANYAYKTKEDGTGENSDGGDGGGIAVFGARMELRNGYIENNVAADDGGGIYCNKSLMEMTGGKVRMNQASYGGGFLITGCPDGLGETEYSITIRGGDISSNAATYDGGGIEVYNTVGLGYPKAVIYDVTISSNTAGSSAGGIMVHSNGSFGTKLHMYGGTVSENTAAQRGGGINADNYAEVELSVYTDPTTNKTTRPEITKNTAARGGGVAICASAKLKVDEGRITFNKAEGTTPGYTAFQVLDSVKTIVDGKEVTVPAKGIGGGVWVVNGSKDNKSTFELVGGAGKTVAIYGNTADFAADDVFANAKNTKLSIPGVSGMDLADYDIDPEGWVEDYVEEDENYDSYGTYMLYLNNAPDQTVKRYSKAGASQRYMLIHDDNVNKLVNEANKYVCLTLGIPTAQADTVVMDYGNVIDINIWKNDLFLYKDALKNEFANGDNLKDCEGSYLLPSLPAGFIGVNENYYSLITIDPQTNEKTGGPAGEYHRTEIQKAHGKVTNNGTGVLRYTPANMNMGSEDVFCYAVAHGDFWYYGIVTVIPATTIYYEDNISSIKYHTNGDAKFETLAEWEHDDDGLQNLLQGTNLDADKIYGYDSSYAGITTAYYSGGAAHKVSVTDTTPARATFTFTGTGFDLISLCNSQTTSVMVNVYEGTADDIVFEDDPSTEYIYEPTMPLATYYVDTWYSTNNSLYQVPVIKVDMTKVQQSEWDPTIPQYDENGNLIGHGDYQFWYQNFGYGTYTVEIFVSTSWFNPSATDFYLDAIRIYNPAGINGTVQEKVIEGYDSDNNPIYKTQNVLRYDMYGIPVKDANGNSIYAKRYIQETDKDGNLIYDDYGMPVYRIQTDDEGNPIYTEDHFVDGTPIPAYEFEYITEYVMKPVGSSVAKDAYLADGEGWPVYQELRDMFLTQKDLNNTDTEGVIYIDGGNTTDVEEYRTMGPNNEVYLAKDQSIAFTLMADNYSEFVEAVHIGMRSASGTASVKIEAKGNNNITPINKNLSSTDLYYDLSSMIGQVVKITNTSGTEDAVVSISNVKVTHSEDPNAGSAETPAVYRMFKMNRTYADIALGILTPEELVESPVVTPKHPALSFNGMVCYNVFFSAENLGDLTADDLGLAVFSTEDTEGTIETAREVIYGATEIDGLYMTATGGVHAKYLGDKQYFRVFARKSDGTYVYSKMVSYSALDYAKNALAKSSDVKLKQLVVAMLNYGAEAQKFFGYKTDDLMNASLTADDQALLNGYAANSLNAVGKVDASKVGAFVSNRGFTFKKPAISFKGAFEINYFFTPANAVDGDMKLYFWNEDTYNSVTELTAENADKVEVMTLEDGTYAASSDEIAAKYLDKTVYVAAVYESDGVTYCSGVLPYSIAAYCQDSPADVQELATAAAIYGCTAKEYFGV